MALLGLRRALFTRPRVTLVNTRLDGAVSTASDLPDDCPRDPRLEHVEDKFTLKFGDVRVRTCHLRRDVGLARRLAMLEDVLPDWACGRHDEGSFQARG